MRIAVWHNTPSGGAQRALFDQVVELTRRGHHVEAWAPPTADRTLLDLGAVVPHHRVAFGGRALTSMRRVPVAKTLLIPQELRAMREHAETVARQIREGCFDVLYCGVCQQFATTPLPAFVDLPSVLYLQEPARWLYETPFVWRRRRVDRHPSSWARKAYDVVATHQRRRQVAEELANGARFDAILANSIFSIESIGRAYGARARLCYLGVDLDSWTPAPAERRKVVVGIGEFAPMKQIDFVVRSVALLPSPRPAVCWIGNRVDRAYLVEVRRTAEELGVEFDARIAISHGEMLGVLASAWVLAYAPMLEPFGFAPLECGATGLPTVAVAEGGVRETVVDGVTGYLVPRDESAMAEALARVLGDASLARTLGGQARSAVVERWSLPASVDRLEAELRRVVDRSSTGRTS